MAGCKGRQGAGRVQGQGAGAGPGLQDSILRFSIKITFLQLFEKKGEGRAGQILGSGAGAAGPGPRPGLREGQGAGQAGRSQGAGPGHRGQGRVARFHFEVFKGLKTSKSRFCNFLRRKGKGGQGRVWVQSV